MNIIKPIHTVYIYHFYNTNIIFVTGLGIDISMIIELPSRFAIYNSGFSYNPSVFKQNVTELHERVGLYNGLLFAIDKDACAVGYLRPDCVRIGFLKQSKTDECAYYKHCCLYQTNPPPSVGHHTNLQIRDIIVINYF